MTTKEEMKVKNNKEGSFWPFTVVVVGITLILAAVILAVTL